MSRRDKNNSHDPDATGSELVPVKFSRLTRRGILLGLSAAQLVTVGIAIATIITALYAGGGMLLAYTAPIWATAALLTWIPIAGRPVIEWVPVADGGSTAPPSASSSTGVASSPHAPQEPSRCPATKRGCVSTPTRPRGRAWSTTPTNRP